MENTYYDKPREFVKKLSEYDNLIVSLKGKTSIQISEIIEKWIAKNESEIADNIIELDAEYIYCEHAAEIVGQILSDGA